MKNFRILSAVALAVALFFAEGTSHALAMDQATWLMVSCADGAYDHPQKVGAVKGLDVVLVIDGNGSMSMIIDDVKARMTQLVQSIHRLAPIARIGIVVSGGKGEKMRIQPLTWSPHRLSAFSNTIKAMGGGKWEDDTYSACEQAIEKMNWKPDAKKVVVLVGNLPPRKEDFPPLLAMIHKFRDHDGTFDTVYIAPEISPLPEFYRRTQAAYKVLAIAGGGSMKSLTKGVKINQQVLSLAAPCPQWQIVAFGSGLYNGIGAAAEAHKYLRPARRPV